MLLSILLSVSQALQGQTTGHQVALETLRKTADALITAEGDLLNNKDEIQEAVGGSYFLKSLFLLYSI